MASRTLPEIHKLITDALPATGGVTIEAFEAGLPVEDARTAMGQVQSLKLSRKIATWLIFNADGTATTMIGLVKNKPVKL